MDNLRKVVKSNVFNGDEQIHLSSVVQFIENLNKIIEEESFFKTFNCSKIVYELNLSLTTRPTENRRGSVLESVNIFDRNGLSLINKFASNELFTAATPLNNLSHSLMPTDLNYPQKILIILDGSDWKNTIKNDLFSDSFKMKVGTALLDNELNIDSSKKSNRFKI